MVYLYGLLAASALGAGFVLQQYAAARAPISDMLSFRLLLDLVRDRTWLFGIAAMASGQLLSVAALARADVSRVEPLLTTNLLFAMLLTRWLTGQRLGVTGWSGVLLLSGGVTAFIVAGAPHGSDNTGSALRRWMVFAVVLGLATVLVLAARHVPLLDEPPLLAAAAGVLYGVQDALTRAASQTVDRHGVVGLVVSWQPYVVVALAVTGLLLVQSAFEAGPLRHSLPTLTAAEPLSGIACGVGFLGDQLRVTPAALAWQCVGLVAAVVGVFLLGRHPAMPSGAPPRRRETATR